MTIIDHALVDKVSSEAKASPRLRMNYNFHQSLEDKCHRMLNAVEPGSDIPLTYGRPRTRLGIAHTSTALRSLLPRFTVIQTKMNHSWCCEVKYVLPHTTMMAL